MIRADKTNSKLCAVVPRHAPDGRPVAAAEAQLGKGAGAPVASPGDASDAVAPDRRKRSGSTTRQRGNPLSFRLLPGERAQLELRAREAGLSIGSYVRASALGSAGPRARRSPPVNAELMAHAVAQLNKAGSNLNQIAHVLNAGRAAGTKECLEALAEVRAAAAKILEVAGRTDRA